MSFITVIKKIGEKVISIVEWPIKHSVQVAKVLDTTIQDEPEVKTAIVGLVEQFEAIGSDVIEDIATKGLDVTTDLKTLADVKALFVYFSKSFVPVIEKTYADVKSDLPDVATVTDTAAPATTETEANPGLHNVVAA